MTKINLATACFYFDSSLVNQASLKYRLSIPNSKYSKIQLSADMTGDFEGFCMSIKKKMMVQCTQTLFHEKSIKNIVQNYLQATCIRCT